MAFGIFEGAQKIKGTHVHLRKLKKEAPGCDAGVVGVLNGSSSNFNFSSSTCFTDILGLVHFFSPQRSLGEETPLGKGVARNFQRGGHTGSYRGCSPDCHLNIVGCLLTKGLQRGDHGQPRTPLATPLLGRRLLLLQRRTT